MKEHFRILILSLALYSRGLVNCTDFSYLLYECQLFVRRCASVRELDRSGVSSYVTGQKTQS